MSNAPQPSAGSRFTKLKKVITFCIGPGTSFGKRFIVCLLAIIIFSPLTHLTKEWVNSWFVSEDAVKVPMPWWFLPAEWIWWAFVFACMTEGYRYKSDGSDERPPTAYLDYPRKN